MKPTSRHYAALACAVLIACVLGCESSGSSTSSTAKTDAPEIRVEPAGNLYRFVWSNDTDGVGILQGNNVAVGIGGARCGFVAYEIKSDGTLDGIWGGYGSDRTGTEKATKQ